MWAATSVIPVVTDRNSCQGGHLRQFAAVPPPRYSFHDRTQGRSPKAALTIATMPAFGSSGRPGQDEQPITSPSLWCSWLVPWAGSPG